MVRVELVAPKRIISSGLVAGIGLLVASFNAYSAQGIPDAGEILQQQQPAVEQLQLERETLFKPVEHPSLPDSKPFFVKRITLTGNQAIDSAQLEPLIAPYQNRELTLKDLQQLCTEITHLYEQQGHLFSRAVVPQQKLKDGALKLRVIEAVLGDVDTQNQSRANVDFLEKILAQAPRGQIIQQSQLNRALLLLKDVPGIKVQTTIRAGKAPGESDLRVAISDQAPAHQLSVNNMGSRHTGRVRMSGNFNFANLVGRGDLLGLSLTSSGELMNQLGLNYELGLGDNSDRLGVRFNYLDYALGGSLKDLDAGGDASTFASYWRHHWVRDLDKNVSSQLQVQRQSLDDQLNNGAVKTQRDVDTLTFSVSADQRDALAGNSITSGQVSITAGHVRFSNSDAKARDQQGSDTQGSFGRINLNFQHRQALNTSLELAVKVNAQLAQDNLDSSQKQSATGPYAVRGYDVGGLSADSLLLTNIELQKRLSRTQYGSFAVYGFIDAAAAKVNHRPLAQSTSDNRVNIAAAGIGVRWQHRTWNGNAFIAAPLGHTPDALEQSKTGVLWFQLSSTF